MHDGVFHLHFRINNVMATDKCLISLLIFVAHLNEIATPSVRNETQMLYRGSADFKKKLFKKNQF